MPRETARAVGRRLLALGYLRVALVVVFVSVLPIFVFLDYRDYREDVEDRKASVTSCDRNVSDRRLEVQDERTEAAYLQVVLRESPAPEVRAAARAARAESLRDIADFHKRIPPGFRCEDAFPKPSFP